MAGTADVDVQDETGTADGNNSASDDNGPNGGTPSLGISIDLSSLFRPPTSYLQLSYFWNSFHE